MKPAIIAATCVTVAALIATPVCAQTLPFYDVDAQVAKCIAESPQGGEQLAKKLAGRRSDAAKSEAEVVKTFCEVLGKADKQIRDELAKRWRSVDSRIRFGCIAAKQVVNYEGLRDCIENLEKRGKTSPDQVIIRR
jgi:hypothetical protein